MADQTQGAIDALLGLLTRAIGDEARLLGGLPGNMQFIKDEMDSMNGFLTHLTKTESEHDDQIRAWMKQVREIAYLAEDCVERYVRDIAPHDGGGVLEDVAFLICHPNKYWLRRRLAKQILELKARVNDVGERRNRYGVKVPTGSELKKAEHAAEEEKRHRRLFTGTEGGPGRRDVHLLECSPAAASCCRSVLHRQGHRPASSPCAAIPRCRGRAWHLEEMPPECR
ncbi:unnamed protein product [Urochloa humidicola]